MSGLRSALLGLAWTVAAIPVPAMALTELSEQDLAEGTEFSIRSPRTKGQPEVILQFGRNRQDPEARPTYYGMHLYCARQQFQQTKLDPNWEHQRPTFLAPVDYLLTKRQDCVLRANLTLPLLKASLEDRDDLRMTVDWEFEYNTDLAAIKRYQTSAKTYQLPYFQLLPRDGSAAKHAWYGPPVKGKEIHTFPDLSGIRPQRSWLTFSVNGVVLEKLEVPIRDSLPPSDQYDYRQKHGVVWRKGPR